MYNITNIVTDKELNEFAKSLLNCGGAYGHIPHPFEDSTLTFGDLKEIIIDALSGKLEAYEKTDGFQLSISWKNNQLIAARNKGHLKNLGENALSKEQLKNMFSDKPQNVKNAINLAIDDLESALLKVSDDILKNIFQEGKRFASLEVISPISKNVIPYGMNLLVFHEIIEYDVDGLPINKLQDSGSILSNIIKSVNASVQKNFVIRGPNKIILNKIRDFEKKRNYYLSLLVKLQSGLSDSTPISQYYINWWISFIKHKTSEFNYIINDNLLSVLVNRWAKNKKSESITQILKIIDNEHFKQWVYKFDKIDVDIIRKKMFEPFETLFFKLGIDVLSNASGFLSLNADETINQIASQVESEVEKIKQSGDVKDIEKLKYELERLNRIGGLEKLAPTEGVTFYKNGKIFKLVGAFSPINKILGLLKYKK